MSDGSIGLSISKAGAILFAVAVVGYLVINGHRQANPTPVTVQVKLTEPHTQPNAGPDLGIKEATPADERLMGPPEDLFMHSSKVGVMFIDRDGEQYAPGQVNFDAGPESNRPGRIEIYPPPPVDTGHSRKRVFLPSSKSGILELPDPFEDEARPDSGLDDGSE
mgnify:CR=1 FL=1